MTAGICERSRVLLEAAVALGVLAELARGIGGPPGSAEERRVDDLLLRVIAGLELGADTSPRGAP